MNLLPQSPEVILFKVKFKTVLWFSILLYLHLISLLIAFFNGHLIRRIKRNFNSLIGYFSFIFDHSTSSKDMSQSLLLLDLLLSLNLWKKEILIVGRPLWGVLSAALITLLRLWWVFLNQASDSHQKTFVHIPPLSSTPSLWVFILPISCRCYRFRYPRPNPGLHIPPSHTHLLSADML